MHQVALAVVAALVATGAPRQPAGPPHPGPAPTWEPHRAGAGPRAPRPAAQPTSVIVLYTADVLEGDGRLFDDEPEAVTSIFDPTTGAFTTIAGPDDFVILQAWGVVDRPYMGAEPGTRPWRGERSSRTIGTAERLTTEAPAGPSLYSSDWHEQDNSFDRWWTGE